MRTTRLILVAVAVFALVIIFFFNLSLSRQKPEFVRLAVIGRGTNDDNVFSVIRLTNAGSTSIQYVGYRAESPLYSYRFQTSAVSKTYNPFWCDTGLQTCLLKAGQSVDFRVSSTLLDEKFQNQNFQVELSYTFPGSMDWLQQNAPSWIARHMPTPRTYTTATPVISVVGIKYPKMLEL
jgi:hypothetical protein